MLAPTGGSDLPGTFTVKGMTALTLPVPRPPPDVAPDQRWRGLQPPRLPGLSTGDGLVPGK